MSDPRGIRAPTPATATTSATGREGRGASRGPGQPGAIRPDRPTLPAEITEGGLVAIARRRDPGTMPAIAEALLDGGIRVLEVTVESDGALETIADLARRFDPGRLTVGAGTVLDAATAERAVGAGARFIVSPVVERDVLDWCVGHGIPCLPGALTPTEIVDAWRAGAAAVKLFPASAVGPSFVRELRGPLPDVPIVPTGGIDAASAVAFLEAGAVAVGVGGWLTGSGDAAIVRARASELVRVVGPGSPDGSLPGLASGR